MIAPRSFRMLAELDIRPLKFVEGHKLTVYRAECGQPQWESCRQVRDRTVGWAPTSGVSKFQKRVWV